MHVWGRLTAPACAVLMSAAFILHSAPGFARGAGCAYFHQRLAALPGLDLYVSTGAFNSIWDGRRIDGCEIVFESHTSILPGDEAHRQFEELLRSPGWKANELLTADGPGSSSAALESRGERCSLHWSQHAWVEDRTHEIRQADEIRIIVQCSDIPD